MKNAVAAAAVATSVAGAASALAAQDMFLKIEGIQGESRDSKHAQEIDVLAWSWGVATPVAAQTGGGGGAGKVVIHDIIISKRMDKSSPSLYLNAAQGKHIPSVVLTVRRGGEKPQEYLTIKLHEVLVSSITTHATAGAGSEYAMEELKLSFLKVELEYKSFDEKGNLVTGGGPHKFGWDIKGNVKL